MDYTICKEMGESLPYLSLVKPDVPHLEEEEKVLGYVVIEMNSIKRERHKLINTSYGS